MVFTRAQVEATMISRRRRVMIRVGLDGVTVDGTNADLTDSIGSAIRLLGGVTIDPILITDADLLTIPEDYQNYILDVTEWYLLGTMIGQFVDVDLVTGPFAAKLSQLADRLQKQWEARRKLLEEAGIVGVEVEAGVILQNFAQHGEVNDTDV